MLLTSMDPGKRKNPEKESIHLFVFNMPRYMNPTEQK